MSESLQLGDYCHGHRWSDADPADPWSVGFVCSIRITEEGTFYKLRGEGVNGRFWKHCRKITADEGAVLLKGGLACSPY